MIDAGRGLENLVLLLYEMQGPIFLGRISLLNDIAGCLHLFRDYVLREAADISAICIEGFANPESAEADPFCRCLTYIRERLLSMAEAERRKRYSGSPVSLSIRIKAALRVSPVRVVYALRISCLLALCTLLVQTLGLPHGKWLLFTVASVSLPYADDVGVKAKKRIAATLIGGLFSVFIFALVPSSAGRTFVMMASGYLSFYFNDYSTIFACSTVGALGGAVFMGAFEWGPVGWLTLVRIGYVTLGIAVALLFNRLILPYKREMATRRLLRRYGSTVAMLTRVCRKGDSDPQLYYELVIQAHLQEEKLRMNAKELQWNGVEELLAKGRTTVRAAHRTGMKLALNS